MMTKRNMIWLAASVWLLVCCASVFAQGTNTPPVIPPPSNPFPVGKDAAWFAFIPLVTFGITWIMGKVKSLPKNILPLLTPIIGVAIGAVIEWATKSNFPWWSEAGAGAISVAIYEALKGVSNAGPESALTPTPQTTTPKT
jgi:hypothetical protein